MNINLTPPCLSLSSLPSPSLPLLDSLFHLSSLLILLPRSHDAARLAVATSAPDLAIVDAETCVPVTRLTPKQPGSITDVSFGEASSPDVVFASSSGGVVMSWDTRTKGKVRGRGRRWGSGGGDGREKESSEPKASVAQQFMM